MKQRIQILAFLTAKEINKCHILRCKVSFKYEVIPVEILETFVKKKSLTHWLQSSK